MKRRAAGAIVAVTALLLLTPSGNYGNTLYVYGAVGSPNRGMVVQLPHASCIGLELWDHPGVFGGSSSECDY